MKRYNPKELEPKWQKIWEENKQYRAIDFDEKPKFVMLTEFPYPSGDGLHLGHVREYTLGDIIARRKRMAGFNVLYPMGYDAFGLPTENYAIKNKITPQTATEKNVGNFEKQFESLGYSFDWDRRINTSDPSYYKWTQWLFLQFFDAGLAYQDEIAINWCPKCRTGLANEEVVNGRHERCDTVVEKKLLKQWMLKITEYADKLINGLETVDYPSRIADQQINWIGRSVGAEIDFKLEEFEESLKVYTTRPDTLFGASFLAIAPEHHLVKTITNHDMQNDVEKYVKQAQSKTDIERQDTGREKTGVFTGTYAVNPLSNEKIPIWVADYVLVGYGTGAIMAVPAHDERDHEFAQKFDLPITRVVQNNSPDSECTHEEGIMINSYEFDGLLSQDAREKIVQKLEEIGAGNVKVQYKLRDWIFSRQHYWGEPIPIIHCPSCGALPVPADQLPVELPVVDQYEPTESGESPLSAIDDWVNVACPRCGGPAKRETDTMPNWAGSSWYYLRYYDSKNDQEFAERKKLEYWGEVDLYLGGMEHTTLHLLYSRFWHQFFYDRGLVPTPEPYAARRGQGIILAEDGSKMSKSKGNVINPNDIIDQGYGADSIRVSIAFLAPYDQTTPWNTKGVPGVYRFLNRFWTLTQDYGAGESTERAEDLTITRATHQVIKKVSRDIEQMQFNTAISGMMEYVNMLYKVKAENGFVARESWNFGLSTLAQLLAPFAPHITEEIWHDLGNDGSVHLSDWPVHDEKYLIDEQLTIVVQVNGKLRSIIVVNIDIDEETIKALALNDETIQKYLQNKKPARVIYIPGRLVNIVVN